MVRTNSAAGKMPSGKEQPTLSVQERQSLESHLEEWNASTGRERKKIMKSSIAEARLLAPKMDSMMLKARRVVRVIFMWCCFHI